MPTRPSFVWDRSIQRYRDARGRLVAERAVRQAMLVARQSAADDAQALTRDFVNRLLSRDDYRDGMRQLIRDTNLYHGAVGYGGFPSMTSADFGLIGQRVASQNAYFERMLAGYESGQISAAQLVARSALYARSGLLTFSDARDQRELARARRGEYRNVITVGENCIECVNISAQQWQPIGTLKPPGQRICRGNCKCHFEYR